MTHIRWILFRIALWYTLRRIDRLLRILRTRDRKRFSAAVSATRARGADTDHNVK